MISRLKLMDFRCYGSFSWQIPQQGAIILGLSLIHISEPTRP